MKIKKFYYELLNQTLLLILGMTCETKSLYGKGFKFFQPLISMVANCSGHSKNKGTKKPRCVLTKTSFAKLFKSRLYIFLTAYRSFFENVNYFVTPHETGNRD